ncbi:MAG: Rpn family recombination-promoting nuclease/putative transposase, partial [Lachnospiraceae bacterium]|nr:Rpn family recombination-promoting nuclease/putative transposase [Lachnospiraceae bacterium]
MVITNDQNASSAFPVPAFKETSPVVGTMMPVVRNTKETNATTKTINKRTFRKLEDLNLIDNFLFHQVLTSEDGEEFARILLSTILDKPIRKVKITPQKNISGVDTNKHGICLDVYIEDVSETDLTNLSDPEKQNLSDAEIIPDVYDIEPNNTYEKNTLPKRTRYYHGLIDTQLLSAGVNYSKLPNMFIIMILPYDPFGKNRMVYTIRNSCIEDTSVPYNDGATKIFLYTKGTEGNPSQALQNMLKYIQESTKENATNDETIKVQEFVDKVKRRKEVGVNYMK